MKAFLIMERERGQRCFGTFSGVVIKVCLTDATDVSRNRERPTSTCHEPFSV